MMILLLLLLQLSQSAATTAPPLPYVDHGACPFECCTYRDWTAEATMIAFKHHDPPERLQRAFVIKRGERVTAMTGVVITAVAGEARISRPTTLEVYSKRFPRAPAEKITLAVGTAVYLLTPQGEGYMSGWANGRLLESFDAAFFTDRQSCEKNPRCQAVVRSEGKREWWVKVRNARGQIGWALIPQKRHVFANNDACG